MPPPFSCYLVDRLPLMDFSNAVEAQPEFIVEGVNLGAATGEQARLAQEHRQAAARQVEAVSGNWKTLPPVAD